MWTQMNTLQGNFEEKLPLHSGSDTAEKLILCELSENTVKTPSKRRFSHAKHANPILILAMGLV